MAGKSLSAYILFSLGVFGSLLVTFVPEFIYSTLFFELLVQSRPYISIIFFIFALFLLLKRYYLLGMMQVACVLMSFFLVFDSYSGLQTVKPCSDGLNSKPIRILSFNVYYKNKKYGELLQAIEVVDADIVLLQEVQSGLYHHAHKRLLDKYAFHYSDFEGGIEHGKALYSKYPLESVKKQKLLGDSHSILQAQINVNGQMMHFIGIHTYSPKNKVRIKNRNAHIEALQDYIVRLADENEYVVVAGDLNTTPWHPVMRHFKEQTQLNNSGFYNIVGTWPTWLPTFLTIPIDQIFYSQNFGHSKHYRGLLSGSDHYPIYVDLEMCK